MAKKQSAPKTVAGGEEQSNSVIQHVNSTCGVLRIERVLPPESDWQFVKIYSGPSMLDELLVDELAPLLSALSAERTITRWFFIRYSDPEPHLRLRFQTRNHAECSRLSRHLGSLLADRRLWKIQFDTYEREIERYGGLAGTLASEEVFCSDSEAVLDILRTLEGDDGLDTRWRIALLGIDTLLTDCGFNLDERLRLMTRLRKSFEGEFRLSSQGKQKLNDRFRSERSKLEAMLLRDVGKQNAAYETAHQAFERRSVRGRSAIAELRMLEQRRELTRDFFDIVGSYVHMHVNRLIRSSPRAHELVLYEFLYRIYDGDCARKKRPLPENVLNAV